MIDKDNFNNFLSTLANNEGKIKYNGYKISNDGKLMAVLVPQRVHIINLETFEEMWTFEDTGNTSSQDCLFSPLNNYFVTYQTHGPKALVNFKLWSIAEGVLVKAWTVRRRLCWPLMQWNWDESVAVFLQQKGKVEFFSGHNFENPSGHHSVAGLMQFSVSQGPEFNVFLFVADSPSYITLHRYPEFNTSIARRNFAKSDSIQLKWDHTGKKILVLTFKDVDKDLYSGRSAGLYLLRDDGYEYMVPIKDNNPIQDFCWKSKGNEFAVISGFVPDTHTSIFDSEANQIAKFDSHSQNTLISSPCGRILAVGGFGNLPGDLTFYDFTDSRSPKVIGRVKAFSTTFHMFSEDSKFFIAATLSPRLRVDNCIQVYSYCGDFLHQENVDELYEVRWSPNPGVEFPPFAIEPQKTIEKKKEEKSTKYVPPKRSVQNEVKEHRPIGGTLVGGNVPKDNKNNQKGKNTNNTNNTNNPQNPPQGGGKPENRKKNILKKLAEIDKLNERIKSGETLEKNQLDKVQNESNLRRELADIELKLKNKN